jgi:hypothetical protein
MYNIKKSLPILSIFILIAVSFSLINGSATTQPIKVISLPAHTDECLTTKRKNNVITCEKIIENTHSIDHSEKNDAIVRDNTPGVETYTASAMINNPHLPVITESIQIETESDDDNSQVYLSTLESGQSITYGYPVSTNSQPPFDIDETSDDGYFLQPGQTRTFSPQLAASHDLANED